MTRRRRRPRTAQERVVGVLGTVAPGSLGGRIRNTRPATVVQPNTGGPPSAGFDADADPVVIGLSADGHSAVGAVSIGSYSQTLDDDCIAIGDAAYASGASGNIAIGVSADVRGNNNVGVGAGAHAGNGITGAVAIGASATADMDNAVAVGVNSWAHADSAVAIGNDSGAKAASGTAIGYNAGVGVGHDQSTAVGAFAGTTKAHQIMLGTASEFVEIPGDSSTAPNGLVLTDTATGTRYIVQITSGALVLNTAP